VLTEYLQTWRATGATGRRFLTGGVMYAIRLLTFMVAFPLFAKTRDFDSGDIGWLIGGSSIALFVFGIPVTMLGARGHTRTLLVSGPLFGIVGVTIILAAPAGAFALTFVGALLTGISSTMFWILGDPLLAATTPPAQRAHIFALKFSLFTAGMSLGGGLGGWIPAALRSIGGMSNERSLAATIVAVVIFDVAQIVAYLKMPIAATRAASPPILSMKTRGSSKLPWKLLVLLAIPEAGMALGHNSIRPFLPLFFEERLGLAPGPIGTIMAGLALIGGIGALFTPAVARRVGNLRTIGILRSLAAVMILLCFSGVGALAVIVFLAVYYSVNDGTEATFITEAIERVAAEHRTIFSGLYAMLWSAASFTAAAASGALQDRPGAGFGAAFGLGVIGYFFSVLWLTIVYPRLPRATRELKTAFDHEEAAELVA
jgi:MFS family permease